MHDNNLKSPAYPQPLLKDEAQGGAISAKEYDPTQGGFTKLEKASLMIAVGLVSKYNLRTPEDQDTIAQMSVQLATAVLIEANK